MSVPPRWLEYARQVMQKERAAQGRRVSRSEVFVWGLKALEKVRHDVPGKVAALLLTAEAGAMKAMKPREVVANVKAVAQELAKMRDDA